MEVKTSISYIIRKAKIDNSTKKNMLFFRAKGNASYIFKGPNVFLVQTLYWILHVNILTIFNAHQKMVGINFKKRKVFEIFCAPIDFKYMYIT